MTDTMESQIKSVLNISYPPYAVRNHGNRIAMLVEQTVTIILLLY